MKESTWLKQDNFDKLFQSNVKFFFGQPLSGTIGTSSSDVSNLLFETLIIPIH